MKKITAFILTLVAQVSLNFAAIPPSSQPQTFTSAASVPKKLPAIKRVQSRTFRTAEDGLEYYFSHNFTPQSPNSHANVTVNQLLKADYTDILNKTGEYGEALKKFSNAETFIIQDFYHDADPEVANLANQVANLAQSDIAEFTIITDLNDAMDFQFAAPTDKSSTDWANMKIASSPTGIILRSHLDNSFSIFKPNKPDGELRSITRAIYSQPKYNKEFGGRKDVEIDIHHMKLFLYGLRDKTTKEPLWMNLKMGSANLSNEPRVNQFWKIKDPIVQEYWLNHERAVIENYKKGQAIHQMEELPTLEVTDSNGNVMYRVRSTLGQFNLNEDIKARNDAAAKNDGGLTIHYQQATEFAPSYREGVESVRDAVAAQKFPFVFHVARQFGGGIGWGHLIHAAGFSVTPAKNFPNAPAFYEPWPEELTKLGEVRVYQSPNLNVAERSQKDEIQDEILHPKTWYMELTEKKGDTQRTFAEVYTLYFNFSKHAANLDVQMTIQFPEGSKMAADVKNSTLQLMKEHPEHAPLARVGVLRIAIASFTLHSLYDQSLDLKTIEEIADAIETGHEDIALSKILSIAKTGTTFEKKLTPQDITKLDERLNRISTFLSDKDFRKSFILSVPSFVDLIKTQTMGIYYEPSHAIMNHYFTGSSAVLIPRAETALDIHPFVKRETAGLNICAESVVQLR
ncbi:MAG: hypothetical protein JWQ35_35 [Bacteriovoracaceae bacterium]|nr:hypothetical protein [Bacteriovoracaceae bacterium]